ncbi:MAG: helix-turn-helix domain-containing protein [Verrucomicrobiota bacterium]
MNNLTQTAEHRALIQIRESAFFQNWRTAFQTATGLIPNLSTDTESDLARSPALADSAPLCQLLNRGAKGCSACTDCHINLLRQAQSSSCTRSCFADLKETAIPIRSGEVVVGYLRTGQVMHDTPDIEQFDENIAPKLDAARVSQSKVDSARNAWTETPKLSRKNYTACVTLLETFAAQLEAELARLIIAENNSEPPMIRKARQYIHAHLDEKITLDDVAKHCAVSPFYFCKVFKQAVGMTLTEFINRRRVEKAKRKLLNPQNRVTEVAYDVGYQSLSQFNRSFLKYTGESPTSYRNLRQSAA